MVIRVLSSISTYVWRQFFFPQHPSGLIQRDLQLVACRYVATLPCRLIWDSSHCAELANTSREQSGCKLPSIQVLPTVLEIFHVKPDFYFHSQDVLLLLSCSVGHSLVVSDSLWLHGLYPIRLLCPWNFPGKNNGVGLPFPSPGDLPDPGIKPASPAL